MTKDGIKKALECCVEYGGCADCPYINDYGHCVDMLITDALDLITEQEKEIGCKDRLKHLSPCDYKEEVANLGVACKYEQEIEQLKENLKNLKADFESLQEDYEFVRDCDAEHCLEINETVKQAKINVLNELKNRLAVHYPSVISEIDKLIKEIEK